MAELATLARPYARAAFDQADQDGALQEWLESLQLLGAVSQQDKIRQLYNSPTTTAAQQSQVMIEVCGDKLGAKAQNLVRLLAENGRLSLLPEVARQFEQLKSNRERTVEVEIASAFDIDAETEKKLAAALQKKLDREVTVNSSVDKELLGGVVIRAGDVVIDGSIRGKLGKLSEVIGA